MKYEQPKQYNKTEIDAIKSSGNEDEIAKMLIGVAFNESNLDFAFVLLNEYALCNNPALVGTALEGFAHIARLHGKLPEDDIVKLFKAYSGSTNDDISWGVQILLDDTKIFMPSFHEKLKEYIG